MSAALAALAVVTVAAALAPRPVRVPTGWGRPSGFERRVAERAMAADLGGIGDAPVTVWVGSGLAGSTPALVAGLTPITVVGLLVGWLAPPLLVVARGDRRGAMLARQLPALVDGLGRQLRVGRTVPQALAELCRDATPPLDAELVRIVRRVDRGRSLAAELGAWAERTDLTDLRLVVTALTLGQRTGGEHAVALDAVAGALRDRRAVAGELDAVTAQARASASIVAAAPVAFAAGLWVLGLAPAVDWDRPLVLGAIVAGLVLDAVGLVWMRRLARPRW